MAQRSQKQDWLRVAHARTQRAAAPMNAFKQKGIGPNKAAGSKGGIRRQGSKRG